MSCPLMRFLIPGVEKTVAVASSKGGVGKSTCAVQLALAARSQGYRVAILDGDIYGPSIPALLGYRASLCLNDKGKIIPLRHRDISYMSIDLMMEAGTMPLIWRGPLIQKAFDHLFSQVEWAHFEPIDLLFIDLPPGTGDIHLSLCQKISLLGALIIMTPDPIAQAQAQKSVAMFQTMKVPILGGIQTMSFFTCETCKSPFYKRGEDFSFLTSLFKSLSVPFLHLPFYKDPLESSFKDDLRPMVNFLMGA